MPFWRVDEGGRGAGRAERAGRMGIGPEGANLSLHSKLGRPRRGGRDALPS